MIIIPGIKYQEELETLPYFNKAAAAALIGKSGKNLDKKIANLQKKAYLLTLKKGLYVSSFFVDRLADKRLYLEYLANILRFPSYISLEYALSEYGLIPEGISSITSITLKSGRIFENSLANFRYQNIKRGLFIGFSQKKFLDKKINYASPAKALFDFLYLKKMANLYLELTEDLRINWTNFSKKDLAEFTKYAKLSSSLKMKRVLIILKKIYDHKFS